MAPVLLAGDDFRRTCMQRRKHGMQADVDISAYMCRIAHTTLAYNVNAIRTFSAKAMAS
jgi:hypothetical protein